MFFLGEKLMRFWKCFSGLKQFESTVDSLDLVKLTVL